MLDVEPDERPPEPEGPPGRQSEEEFPDFYPEVIPVQESDSDVELGVVPEVQRKGTYVVSITGRSKKRALHKVGECFRVPGQRYSNYEALGYEPPDPATFHHACKACFSARGGACAPVARGVSDSSEGLSAASSSDTSSGEE